MPDEAGRLLGRAARLIGMQCYDETAALLGLPGGDAVSFARYLATLLRAQGEDVEVEAAGDEARVRLRGWRLTAGIPGLAPEAFDAWLELWRGALSVHNRRLALDRGGNAAGGVVELRIGGGRGEARR